MFLLYKLKVFSSLRTTESEFDICTMLGPTVPKIILTTDRDGRLRIIVSSEIYFLFSASNLILHALATEARYNMAGQAISSHTSMLRSK